MSGEGRETGEAPSGFEELALPLFGSLYNFARWLCRDRDEAEDLVQETFAKALRGFSTFQPGTSFKSWIFRILKNTWLTSRSGLRAHALVALDPEAEETLAEPGDATPETLLIARTNLALVREAIASLSEPFREAVLLRDVEGLAYQEIAEVLDVPVGTVMSRLARGRHEIRREIERKLGRR